MKKIYAIVLFFILIGAVIIIIPFLVKSHQQSNLTTVGGSVSSATGNHKTDTDKKEEGIDLMVGSSLQHLVMPGPVIEAHAKAENDCTSCHSPFDGTSQGSLCLVCHLDIKKDIDTKRGFHGNSVSVNSQSCKNCHTDHKGRDAKIVVLDKSTFDHDQTGFKLKGGHTNPSVSCEKCHLLKTKKFREAPSTCFGCHEKDDHHRGQLGKDCGSCHQESSWKDSHYDHSKTKFPLTGKHKDVACALCHLNNQYKGTPLDCLSCHKINDVHADKKRTQCDKCHNTEGWHEKIKFDHDKETKFPLKNSHSKPTCVDCHKNLIFNTVDGAHCVDCHQVDDVHRGRYGLKCETCHSDVGWKKIAFEHDRDTKFKLLGKHKEAQCMDCHKRDKGNDMKLDMACGSCHAQDDVHKGSLGNKCQNCHNEKGWSVDVAFDHDLTRFPLVGLHATTSCGACHLTRDYKSVGLACINCHKKDDYHKSTLGTNCGWCHTPNGWKIWHFDHNKQTKYPLEGAHEGLACSKCHVAPALDSKVPERSSACFDCHEKQNKHGLMYGNVYKQCDLCHITKDFRIINQSKIKRFHTPPMDQTVGLEENCGSCHQKNDVHNGSYGPQCGTCHTVDSWKDLTKIGR